MCLISGFRIKLSEFNERKHIMTRMKSQQSYLPVNLEKNVTKIKDHVTFTHQGHLRNERRCCRLLDVQMVSHP